MTGPIDATSFPDAEAAVIAVIKAAMTSVYVSNTTPAPIPAKAVVVGTSGTGFREWGEAAVNVGVNVYATTDEGANGVRALVTAVQNALAKASNGLIERIAVPVGATSIPRQTPPFQRYFVVTVYLRGQAVI